MGKSISAKAMSALLELFPKSTAEEQEEKHAKALIEGEKPSQPPKNIVTRYEENEHGRIFYANEKSVSRYTVFYIHGGAYQMDFLSMHWQFIEKLVEETNALVIAPGYRYVPFGNYKDALDLIVPVYKQYCEDHPEQKIMMMGDSAGGGLALVLTEHFKQEGIRLPDELVLFSPLVDCSAENEEIKEYQEKDPFILSMPSPPFAVRWADGPDMHDWHISPIFGDLKGIKNVTIFIGTDEVLYPDVKKLFHMLDKDVSNDLVVAEGMNHCYPLLPIEEARSACNKVFHIVMR